jgi:hypothetical protein
LYEKDGMMEKLVTCDLLHVLIVSNGC